MKEQVHFIPGYFRCFAVCKVELRCARLLQHRERVFQLLREPSITVERVFQEPLCASSWRTTA